MIMVIHPLERSTSNQLALLDFLSSPKEWMDDQDSYEMEELSDDEQDFEILVT